jgi:hypothetical protein
MSATDSIKNKFIKQAVKKLKRFGFVNVTPENIMQDEVYKFYFDKMLRINIGCNAAWDTIIKKLLKELNPAKRKTDSD